MAFTHDKDFTTTATGTQTLTVPTSTIPAGSLVTICSENRNALPTNVTDSRNNNYRPAQQVSGGAGNKFVSIWYSVPNTTLQISDTITLTYGAGGFGEAVCSSFTSDTSVCLSDGFGTTQGAATALSSITVRAVPQIDDLVVACWANSVGAITFTKGASYTLGGDVSNSSSQISSEWKLATVAGAQTADATYGTSTATASVVAIFAPYPPIVPVNPSDLPLIYQRTNV